MITLRVYKDDFVDIDNNLYPVIEIQFFNKINIVLGNSGTGKSYFFSRLLLALNRSDPWSCTCIDSFGNNIKVRAINSLDLFNDTINNMKDSVIVVDEDITESIQRDRIIDKLEKYNNYFILLDRDLDTKLDININASLIVKESNLNGERIIRFLPHVTMQKQDITENIYNKITHIVTEDTTSGKIFWQIVLNKLTMLDCDNPGSGGIEATLKRCLEGIDGNILVALDYDRCSHVIESIAKSKDIDKSRIHFIPLESFEEVICNSDFILQKYPNLRERVINYKDYITSEYKSTGNYFSTLLFRYVKQKSPIYTNSKRNIEQFYSKGMKNFIECFILNCCSYSKEDCKLYYTGDKKQAMLANKFEQYRIFIDNNQGDSDGEY